MASSSSSVSGSGEAMEMELDEHGRSFRLESKEGDSVEKVIANAPKKSIPGSAPAVSTGGGDAMKLEELEALIKSLTLGEAKKENISKVEVISKLEVARTESADEKRNARKAAWIAEAREEVARRQQFKAMAEALPELVWKLLLEKLESKDKATVSRMCLLWRDLLKLERTTFLFHEVFPLLHQRGCYPSRSAILNSRAASKEWKRSIENYLQMKLDANQPPSLAGIDVTNVVFPVADCLEVDFHGDQNQVAKFMKGIEATYETDAGGNPFISRKLKLGSFASEDPAAVQINFNWRQVGDLLRKCGNQVWGAGILLNHRVPDVRFNVVKLYIRVCLSLMPNLRSVSLYRNGNQQQPLLGVVPRSVQLERMNNMVLTEDTLPDLPHLKTLICRAIPAPVIVEMLKKYGSTLESVAITEYSGGTPNGGAENSKLPNLKQFRLTTKEPRNPWKILEVDWPLVEEIYMAGKNIKLADIPRLFQSLNRFGSSLRVLTLSLHRGKGPRGYLEEREWKMLSLELPHLEEFTLSVVQFSLKTIDFILPMTSLKKLTIIFVNFIQPERRESLTFFSPAWMDGFLSSSFENTNEPAGASTSETAKSADDTSGDNEIIKFRKYKKQLYESNIWKLLPELKMVTITGINKVMERTRTRSRSYVSQTNKTHQAYTREGYNQYVRDDSGQEGEI